MYRERAPRENESSAPQACIEEESRVPAVQAPESYPPRTPTPRSLSVSVSVALSLCLSLSLSCVCPKLEREGALPLDVPVPSFL